MLPRKTLLLCFVFPSIAFADRNLVPLPDCNDIIFEKSIRNFFENPIETFDEQKIPKGFQIIVISNLSESLVNLNMADKVSNEETAINIEQLLKLAFHPTVSPYPQKNIMTYSLGTHGLYLSHLNIALNAYVKVNTSDQYHKLTQRISEHLANLTLKDPYVHVPSFSYYQYRFPADQAATLYSLYLYDKNFKKNVSKEPIRRWLKYMAEKGTDLRWSLHVSEVTGSTNTSQLPRGCALSWTVRYMAPFAPQEAKNLWQNYKQVFKIDAVVAVGFREWPPGVKRKADIDSGPIFFGIGSAASGIALAASKVMDDQSTYRQLFVTSMFAKELGASKKQNPLNSIVAHSIELFAQTYTPWFSIDIGRLSQAFPVTPPGIRVRTTAVRLVKHLTDLSISQGPACQNKH